MVQLSNVLTIMVAGSSVVTATHNMKRSTKASAQADAKSAAESFQNLLTIFSNNIGSGDQLAASEMQTALQGYVGMLQTITKLSVSNAVNTTAFVPNWEGAVIGGGLMSQVGLLTGALMGVTTSWTYKGFNDGLSSILGFDPLQALSGLPMGIPLPDPVSVMTPPPPPAAPKPVVASPPVAPVASPKPPVAPAPVAPVAPKIPTPASTPKAAAPPAAPAPMKGMGGMGGHSHGGWVDAPYGEERK